VEGQETVVYAQNDVIAKAKAEIELLQSDVDYLKSKTANLEDIVSDVIARNCLLMKPIQSAVEAGESHSADAVA